MKPWVAFTLLGALLFAVGNALQKHGLAGRLPPLTARAAAAGPLRFFGAMARSPTWLLGTAITLVAVAAGALFGLGDVMMKAGTEGVRAHLGAFDLARGDAAAALVASPEFQLAIAFGAGAFLLQQLAFSRGRVSLVAPIVGVGATALVVVLGVVFLGESLGRGRALGIGFTVVGTLLVAGREASGARLAAA